MGPQGPPRPFLVRKSQLLCSFWMLRVSIHDALRRESKYLLYYYYINEQEQEQKHEHAHEQQGQ